MPIPPSWPIDETPQKPTVVLCVNCGAPMESQSAQYCKYCGADRKTGKVPKCSNCGAPITAWAEKCRYCKAPILGRTATPQADLFSANARATADADRAWNEIDSNGSNAGHSAKLLIGIILFTVSVAIMATVGGAINNQSLQNAMAGASALLGVVLFLAMAAIMLRLLTREI